MTTSSNHAQKKATRFGPGRPAPLGPDAARTKLRAALMAHIHQQETPAQIKKQGGLARWLPNAGHTAQENLKLLVGDPITLIVR